MLALSHFDPIEANIRYRFGAGDLSPQVAAQDVLSPEVTQAGVDGKGEHLGLRFLHFGSQAFQI
jgi:hypothetical protein